MRQTTLALNEDLVHALDDLARWEESPEIRMAADLIRLALEKALPERDRRFRFASLTERERQVLVLHARGVTRSQISEQLCIAPQTLKVHLRNIRMKLGLRSIAEIRIYLKYHPISEIDPEMQISIK